MGAEPVGACTGAAASAVFLAPVRPTTPSDPPLQRIPYGDGHLTYTDEGEGDVVVAIHGLPGTVRDFRWLAAAMLPGVRFVRLDLPGYGGTTRHGYTGMSIAERGPAVVALLDALDLHAVTVIGHSFGGVMAAEVARHHPDRVARCVLVASPGPRRHVPKLIFQVMAPLFRFRAGRALLAPLQRQMYRSLGFPSSLTDDARAYTSLDIGAADFTIHADNLAHLPQPTLTAWAADDALIPTPFFEELEALVPDGPRLRFEDGGHNIQKTRAVELATAITAFLAD